MSILQILFDKIFQILFVIEFIPRDVHTKDTRK